MRKCIESFKALSKFELGLWLFSAFAVISSFLIGGSEDYLTLTASLVGVTALIFVAKGDVLGQILTLIFSVLYAVISYRFRYFGEMITYLGMTAPIAALSVYSWLRHPYDKNKNEVQVARLTKRDVFSGVVLAIAVTAAFYFILKYFNNANLIVSTVSVTTSFLASYLMFKRSTLYALAYGANDIILIILWVLASLENISYLPMVICFVMFLCNDIYGFLSWERMKRRQTPENSVPR